MLANPAEFFRHIRTELFAGSMTEPQVAGTNAVGYDVVLVRRGADRNHGA
ncbi:hypothetical protein [Rhodoblastus sp.]